MRQIKKPPRKILSAVFDILEEKEIFLEESSVEITLAVVLHYLEAYPSGNEELANLLKLVPSNARTDKRYVISDNYGALTKEVKAEKIIFLEGCIVDGEAVDPKHVKIYEAHTDNCESCGARVVCSEIFEGNEFCSHCLALSESQKARDTATMNCNECSYDRCAWHPSKEAELTLMEKECHG